MGRGVPPFVVDLFVPPFRTAHGAPLREGSRPWAQPWGHEAPPALKHRALHVGLLDRMAEVVWAKAARAV